MKAYLIDHNAVWNGEEIEFNPNQGRPPNAITVQPPEFDSETEYATWSGEEWLIRSLDDLPPEPVPIITPEQINAEHDRRTLAGRAFPVQGAGDVPLEGSESTKVVLLALKDTARDLKAAGVTAPILRFTDRDNVDQLLTADQMIGLVNAGKAWMQSVHDAKRALKEMEPIPQDYADDKYWPEY